MTIAELAEEADVTPRTVRYYVEQGLLPPPGRGRVAEYTEEHLQLLGLIARLKRHYLPLDEIRETLQRLSREEIEELLARDEPATGAMQEQSSAADYITSLFERGHVREQAMMREPSPDYFMSPPPSPVASAPPPDPASQPLTAPAARPVQPAPEVRTPSYISAPPRVEAPVAEATEVAQAPPNEESTWHRVTVAPGVELHFHASASARVRSVMSRLIKVVGNILETSPEKETEDK